MIVWDILKQDLLSYFESNTSRQDTEPYYDEFADKIATGYETSLLGGTVKLGFSPPIDGYTVLSWIKEPLKAAIASALPLNATPAATLDTAKLNLGTNISTGLVASWTGAQLSLLPPPLGFAVVASNVVLTPGTPQIFDLQKDSTNEQFIDALIKLFTDHLKTVAGLAVGSTPVPTPITLPWTGIE